MRTSLLTLGLAAIAAVASAQTITIGQTSIPPGTQSVFYTAQLSATGGSGSYSWSIGTGNSDGLNINSISGLLSGTPAGAGQFTFSVFVHDIGNGFGSQTFTFNVANVGGTLAVTNSSFPTGTVGTSYPFQTLTASGGTPPYFFSINGSLPPGLNLNSGFISGTPTTAGTFPFNVVVTDTSETNTAQKALSITITPLGGFATINTTTLPNGTVNIVYNSGLTCTNCSGYSWSVSGGSLPSGLSLNAVTGAISGTPNQAGIYPFQVALANPKISGSAVTQNLSITIQSATPPTIDQPTIPPAFQNVAYSTTLTASGGTAPYTWSIQGTAAANGGVTINPTTGVISGTPPTQGQFTLNVLLTDSVGGTATHVFILTVSAGLSILTTSLPNGVVGTAYPQQNLSAGGGQPPYRWSISAGSLPAGLTLDGVFGRISGTPTVSGASPFTLVVTDNQGATANAKLSITVTGTAVTITVTPTTLPAGTVGTAYSQTMTATGGQSPYTFALTAGTLPAGLTLSSAGLVSGTPTATGASTFTVQATDANKATGQAAVSLTINATAPSPLTITTAALPNGTIGTAYSQTLAATGGQTPYTWALGTGTLPAGVTLSSAGVISGTPTAAATSTFSVQVTDAAKATAQKSLSITVAAAATPLTYTPTTLPAAVVGVAYTQKLTAAGGVAPYTFAVANGNLPSGFTFTASTATITGTAPAAESGNFTISVTDSAGTVFSQGLTLTANNPPTPTVTVTLSGPGSGFSQQIPVTLALAAPYPVAINGSVVLTFAPSVTPAAGVDDQMIQFSAGSRVINFTIPAGSTSPTLSGASSITVLTGTTAGTITLTTSLTAGGVALAGPAPKTIVNAAGVPFISSVTFQQTPGGITVTVSGFSSTRDMVSGLFHFAPASNVTLTQSDITESLAAPFTTWYSNTAASNPFGTQFTLTAPFSLSTQSTSIVSVTVTLTNSKGASNPVSPTQ
jgi:hypothetical protein